MRRSLDSLKGRSDTMARKRRRDGDEQARAATSDMSADQRMQYDELQREQQQTEYRHGSPSPYDEAPAGTPPEQVIRKGEREQVPDVTDGEAAGAGDADATGGGMRRDAVRAESGDLGGGALHARLNTDASPDDFEDFDRADGRADIEDNAAGDEEYPR
jgi:hypothetical protein